MRTIIVILVLLAAGKVAAIEWLHRSASDDVIINAYRPRAVEACGVDARRFAVAGGDSVWTSDATIHLEIGPRNNAVRFWQVDHPAWTTHFRNPFLYLEAGPPAARLRCEYDIIKGAPTAAKL